MLELSRFDYYLIIINIIGFLYFLIYIYFLAGESSNVSDTIMTILSLCFGSLGIALSMIIFGRTPKYRKKETMMSRVFIWCILVIQIILLLIIKGYIRNDLTINAIEYFKANPIIVIYLLVINIITLIAFALDKIHSIEGNKRIRISVLLFLSFIGGSIGALLAMYIFRHKTRQDYFTVGVPLIIIMQLFCIFYLMNRP